MKLTKMEIYRPVIEYKEPFVTSGRARAAAPSEKRRSIILKLYTDEGEVGWGEAGTWTNVTGETEQMCIDALSRVFPKLVDLGNSVMDIEKLHRVMLEEMGLTPGAQMGIDIATLDLFGKYCKQPLFKLLGGYRDRVDVDRAIGMKKTESMVQDAAKFASQGFKLIKFKVGLNPEEDLKRIKLIREAIGDDVGVAVDANQGWTFEQALDVLSKAGRYELEFAEQPIKMDDIEGLRMLRMRTSVPIMADETVRTPSDAIKVLEREAVDMVNIKLVKCGGVWNARKIAAICEAFHVPNMIGAGGFMWMLASVHFACGIRNVHYADLDVDHLFKRNIILKGGTDVPPYRSYRALGPGPGLGIEEVDEEFLGEPTMVFQGK